VSKASAPRPRYVAFRLDGDDAGRRKVADAVRALAPWMQLTRFGHPHGIVRVDHDRLAQARRLLSGGQIAGSRVETLGTSGTLKALTTRLGILQKRD
jgi:RNase P/RNase MRP subunit POP5